MAHFQIQKIFSACVTSLAKIDASNYLPSLFRRREITIYASQNLVLPNFEGEQPGNVVRFIILIRR